MATKSKHKGLLNKFVHIYGKEPLEFFPNYEYVQQQAHIIGIVSCDEQGYPTSYEVQWFDCGWGLPNVSKIVSVEEMMREKWGFYETEEEWREQTEKTFEVLKRNSEMKLKTKGEKQ